MDDSDTDTGLAFEPGGDWEPDIVRSAAEALAPLDLDLGTRAAFAPEPRTGLDGIGDRLEPDGGGLWVTTDGDQLRDDLAKLREHEADLKLRTLLDKAERALDARRYEEAWTHARAALEIAPTNVTALLLGARCQHVLGEYEAALDLLATAREHARDADEVTLVTRLRNLTERRLVDQIGEHAYGMLDHNHDAAAAAYVERQLAQRPGHLGLLYIYGVVLLRVGRLLDARNIVEVALFANGPIGRFEELHQAILAAMCAPTVERARKSVRAGQHKEAIDQLATCGEVVRTDSRYARLWSYAHERHANESSAGRRRARKADFTPLDADGLQVVLLWVLSEELSAGTKAFHNADFDGVSRYCTRAEAIDSRCGTVFYLHAMSEKFAADRILDKIGLVTVTAAKRHLTAAARLAKQATQDPELIDKSTLLSTRIAADLAEVAKFSRLLNCMARFNALTKRYERRHIQTNKEMEYVRRELDLIRSTAEACRREHAPGSSAYRTMDNLIGAIRALT